MDKPLGKGDFIWNEKGEAEFRPKPDGKFYYFKQFKDGSYLIKLK